MLNSNTAIILQEILCFNADASLNLLVLLVALKIFYEIYCLFLPKPCMFIAS